MIRGTTVCAVLFLVGAAAAVDDSGHWAAWSRWEPLALPWGDAETEYATVRDGKREAMRAESRCSASALAVPLDGIDLREWPILRWSWKVEQPLARRDERAKSGDDFAARVYVMFRFDPDRATWSERVRHRLGSALFGRDLPWTALNYVWTTGEPPGQRWDNPFSGSSKMISLGAGLLPDWRREEVDVLRDYEQAFGREPPDLLALAIMTDADNTCSHAVALFVDFEWAPRAAAEEGG